MIGLDGPAPTGIRGVLFDKDGTLIDLHASWIGAGQVLGQRLCVMAGRPWELPSLLEESGYDPVAGYLDPRGTWASGTTESLVRAWIARLGLDGGENLVADMLALMTDEANRNIVPLADLNEAFARVVTSGRRVGVATMDLEASARTAMSRLGVHTVIDFLCGCDSGHGHKPGPGMVLAFCAACDLTPAQVMVVGDTPHDMHMGREAGAGLVVGVTSGAASRQLLASLADHVVSDVSAAIQLLDDSTTDG